MVYAARMLALTAAVILVGLLSILNLTLTYGLIRRLREHTDHLNKLLGQRPRDEVMLAAGSSIGDFTTTTTDGAVVSAAQLNGRTLVGFFSSQCEPCKERLPEFVAYAGRVPGGRKRVLAVVLSEEGEKDNAAMVSALQPVARVVVEDDGGPTTKALGVTGYPALGVIGPEAVIEVSGTDFATFPAASSL